ncbi:MAG: cation:proton antiporter [Acidobacteriota bacterium]
MPDSQLHIPLTLFVLFTAAKLLGELSERLHQPAIVGEILAGVLLGPSILGWVAPNQVLTALSELGVMFLLFRVGLEVNPADLIKQSGSAMLVATLGVVLPMGLGWGIITWWGLPQAEALFVGAAMVATSVGITAQVLASKGLLNHPASRVILAAAVIDDVLGLLVLAAVSSVASGSLKVIEIATTAAIAVAFVTVIALWGNRLMGKVVPRVQESARAAEGEYAMALILLFGLSALAVVAGVAAIVGAFFAGMALSGRVGHRVHELTHGAAELLIPFFLAGIGLHVELGAFRSGPLVTLTAVIVVAAVASKFLGCGVASLKMGKLDAIRIGVGMIPRGEVGMVVAQLGLSLGAISNEIYAVVVFMAVATTVIAPPLLNVAFRGLKAESPEETYRLG